MGLFLCVHVWHNKLAVCSPFSHVLLCIHQFFIYYFLSIQARLQAVTEMEDLVREVPTSGVGLRLEKMERYLHGPTAATASCYASGEDVMTAFHNVSNHMEAWQSHSAMVRAIKHVNVCV